MGNKSKISILFFSKKNWTYSTQALDLLRHLNFDVTPVFTSSRDEIIDEDIGWWQGDYIISFRSYHIIEKSLLRRASCAAINFHPAPVDYPGSGCTNWALYEDAKEYGVTVHIMNEKIDNGEIIECRRFPIFEYDNIETLLQRTYHKMYDLFLDTITGIKLNSMDFINAKIKKSRKVKWKGIAKKINLIDDLQNIKFDCSVNELNKIIRATHTEKFPPYIILHGYKFVLNY